MLSEFLNLLQAIWLDMVAGTVLVATAAWSGWIIGGHRSFVLVRAIAGWVVHVVEPLLRSRSWSRRTATIFVNNASIMGVLLAVGVWRIAALVGTVTVGLTLGIGFRVLSKRGAGFLLPDIAYDSTARRRIRLGVALNLLEPPAIILTLGLSIGRSGGAPTAAGVWETFALWVMPALLLAAAGEALWIGASRGSLPARNRDMSHRSQTPPPG